MTEFLPCPFCGSDDVEFIGLDHPEACFYQGALGEFVVCNKCEATAGNHNWNTRAEPPWQPISTIPDKIKKEGTDFLAVVAYDDCLDDTECKIISYQDSKGLWSCQGFEGIDNQTPLLWMPIPAPPKVPK